MSPLYVLGRTLVSAAALEQAGSGSIERFVREARSNPAATLAIGSRTLRASDLARPEGVPEFTPVGIGRPLSLEILSAYAGDAPARFGMVGRSDLLITSALKAVTTFDAAPRAIHAIVPGVADHALLTPSALRPGSPVAFYARSLVDGTLLCAFEFAADALDPKLIEHVADLLALAGGLPVFAPAASFLLAAGGIVKLGGELASVLLRPSTYLHADLTLRFETPGIPADFARMIVACNPADEDELTGCELGMHTGKGSGSTPVLKAKDSGEEYRGRAPYMIVSLDGRSRPELDGFAPTQASAALLERFYDPRPAEHVVQVLADALVLYDDLVFRRKADELARRMKSLRDHGSEEYRSAKKLYDAYRAYIRTDAFRPGEAP